MAVETLGALTSAGLGWTPYCGAGPTPAELMMRWNTDPWVLAALCAGAGAWVMLRRRRSQADAWALGGLALLIVSFVSPLCALSSALFSARVVHHAILILGVAPLLAFALPKPRRRLPLAAATFVQAIALWAWHAPAAYGWALSNDGAYWLMQGSLAGSALAFWVAARSAGGIAAAAALLASMVQTGLLGALITFAPDPLYTPHLLTTWAWGLSPLTDQQLGGLIMWAPMAGGYLLAALHSVGRILEPAPSPAASA